MLPTKIQFIWPSGFRGEDLKKQANQKQELPVVAMFVNGWGISEEKIKMWKVNGRQTTDAKWWQKLTLPLARWAKTLTKREKKKKK